MSPLRQIIAGLLIGIPGGLAVNALPIGEGAPVKAEAPAPARPGNDYKLLFDLAAAGDRVNRLEGTLRAIETQNTVLARLVDSLVAAREIE